MNRKFPTAGHRLTAEKRSGPARSSSIAHRCAFTLMEVLMAIAIFSLVLATIYSTWLLIMRASRVTQTVSAQVQRQRVAIRTIEEGLTSIQSFQASMKYYSFVVENGDTPMLNFTARVPEGFPRNGKFGDYDVRRLMFGLEPGANLENDLVLRQKPILMDMDENEQKFPLVLARDVQRFRVECWDTNADDWVDGWDDTNSIPPLIRVTLVLGGNKHNDNLAGSAPPLAITRVIAVPSQTLPAVVQTGGGSVGVPVPLQAGGGGTKVIPINPGVGGNMRGGGGGIRMGGR